MSEVSINTLIEILLKDVGLFLFKKLITAEIFFALTLFLAGYLIPTDRALLKL